MATRTEHRRETLLRLSAATTEAFTADGLDATVDDIARRAGVSRRTVHRWVGSRDELVSIHPRLWLEYFDEAVAEVADEPLRSRVMYGSERVSSIIDADPEPVAQAMAIALEHPSLMRGYGATTQMWIERLSSEIAKDLPDDPFRSRVLGAAIMGVIDAALADWLASNPRVELVDVIGRGLDLLAPILDRVDPG